MFRSNLVIVVGFMVFGSVTPLATVALVVSFGRPEALLAATAFLVLGVGSGIIAVAGCIWQQLQVIDSKLDRLGGEK